MAALRARRAETTYVEVKAALRGAPHSARETLSSFANGRGGVMLLGLSEDTNVAAVPGFEADRVREAMAGMASNDVTPPMRGTVEIEEFEGARIVRVDVPELDVIEKPCFVTARGEYGGSYARSGDGDRRMTRYEVTQLLANRGQPTEDREPVSGARVSDLDQEAIRSLLGRVRERQPRAFATIGDEDVLMRLGVLVLHEDELVPTLAGVLCLSTYPQQYFPQLNVTLVALPGREMGETSSSGARFLDSQSCDGPIPEMVAQAVAAVIRNMTRAAHVVGTGRQDRYEYPVEVVRELIVNALMHRDYSPAARGSQVQVELYPDRLVVRSPGGIFGGVDVAQFGASGVTSSRNATLARLLSDLVVPTSQEAICENRGSGIPTIMTALRDGGMAPPRFHATLTRVQVTVPRHALLDTETFTWLTSLHQPDLSDGQRMALAMLRLGTEVSNETLRGWGLHRTDATAALADLVRRGLARRNGSRRYASHELAVPDRSHPELQWEEDGSGPGANARTALSSAALAAVLRALSADKPVRIRDLRNAEGLTYAEALARVNRLIEMGWVGATAPAQSKNRAYLLTPTGLRAREGAG